RQERGSDGVDDSRAAGKTRGSTGRSRQCVDLSDAEWLCHGYDGGCGWRAVVELTCRALDNCMQGQQHSQKTLAGSWLCGIDLPFMVSEDRRAGKTHHLDL